MVEKRFVLHSRNKTKKEVVNLFWTGGWDSTFRLLQLILMHKKLVQPYYLIDPTRRSVLHEIKAQREIKNKVCREYPYTKKLILPTIFHEVGDIDSDEEIANAYSNVRAIKKIDYQYSWLARYCKQFNIWDMELCEQNLGHLEVIPELRLFSSFLVPIRNSRAAQIAEEFVGTDIQTIFQYFQFPIRGYTRKDMEIEAKIWGWANYLYMTWSCHNPVLGRYPCGTCSPCELTIKQGYAKRIPWRRRLYARSGLEKIRLKIARVIRRINPDFHKWKGGYNLSSKNNGKFN